MVGAAVTRTWEGREVGREGGREGEGGGREGRRERAREREEERENCMNHSSQRHSADTHSLVPCCSHHGQKYTSQPHSGVSIPSTAVPWHQMPAACRPLHWHC